MWSQPSQIDFILRARPRTDLNRVPHFILDSYFWWSIVRACGGLLFHSGRIRSWSNDDDLTSGTLLVPTDWRHRTRAMDIRLVTIQRNDWKVAPTFRVALFGCDHDHDHFSWIVFFVDLWGCMSVISSAANVKLFLYHRHCIHTIELQGLGFNNPESPVRVRRESWSKGSHHSSSYLLFNKSRFNWWECISNGTWCKCVYLALAITWLRCYEIHPTRG